MKSMNMEEMETAENHRKKINMQKKIIAAHFLWKIYLIFDFYSFQTPQPMIYFLCVHRSGAA
jgi:hypothetical protein